MNQHSSLTPMMVVLLASILLSGCLFTKVKVPYDTDLNQTTLGAKSGEAHMVSVLWLFAWGDAGTAAAARNGDISTVHHMDREVFSILFGLYTRNTTIVYGD